VNRDNDSDSNDNTDIKTQASVTPSRRSTGHSRAMAAVLESIQKNPPSAQLPHNNTDNANCSRRNSSTTTIHAPRNTMGQSVTNVENPEPVSPPFASLPTASPPGILPSPSAGNSTTAQHSHHAIAAIQAHELLDDALSLSVTEHDNAKSMRLLNQYFQSLAQSGTTRSITEEKDLITSKISILFKHIKFINTDTDLTFEGNIAKILYKEMCIPDNFKAVWWEQIKNHVRKKMDER